MQSIVTTHPQGLSFHGDPTILYIVIGGLLLIYLAWCYMLKRICDKCGTKAGLLIWIPIFKMIRLLQAAGMSGWLFLLLFVPIANLVLTIIMWVKICQALGKSPLLVILLFIPIVNLFFVPYLAFTD